MGHLFSRSQGPEGDAGKKQRGTGGEVTDRDVAVLELKSTRDRVRKMRKKHEEDSERFRQQAMDLLRAGNQERALMCLKLKKLRTQRLDELDTQLLNLYQLIETAEWEIEQARVMEGIKSGNQVLKSLHETMSVDDVAKLMDETKEAIDAQNEISELLGGASTVVDDDSVLEELARLEAEEEGEKEGEKTVEAAVPCMPEAPRHEVQAPASVPAQADGRSEERVAVPGLGQSVDREYIRPRIVKAVQKQKGWLERLGTGYSRQRQPQEQQS